jgi:hypothetical protein
MQRPRTRPATPGRKGRSGTTAASDWVTGPAKDGGADPVDSGTMAQPADSKLTAPSSLIALVVGAVGATLETVAFVAYLVRGHAASAPRPGILAVADGVIAALALAGTGLTIKSPQRGAVVLAVAGVASFLSDLTGLSTPPRMIPGGLMILSAVMTFALSKEHARHPAETVHADPQWLRVVVNVAIALHVIGAGFIGLGAGLVAPPVGVLVGWVIWAAILFVGLRLRRPRPWLALITPFAGVGAWYSLLLLGGAVFGWTA